MAPAAVYLLLAVAVLASLACRLILTIRYEWLDVIESQPHAGVRLAERAFIRGFDSLAGYTDPQSWYKLEPVDGPAERTGLALMVAAVSWALHLLYLPANMPTIASFMPLLFAATSTVFCFFVGIETVRGDNRATWIGLVAAALMSIVPAYAQRTVAGAFYNESVAVSLILMALYAWMRALRRSGSALWAAGAATACAFLAACWSAYTIAVNVIAIHAANLAFCNVKLKEVFLAYSLFYTGLLSLLVLGPPPLPGALRSTDLVLATAAFFWVIFRVLLDVYRDFVTETHRRRSHRRLLLWSLSIAIGAAAIYFAVQGAEPRATLSRLLDLITVPHALREFIDPFYVARLPLLASIGDRRPSSWASLFVDLHLLGPGMVAGAYILCRRGTPQATLLLSYAGSAAYLTSVAVRMTFLLAPAACILSAVAVTEVASENVSAACSTVASWLGSTRQNAITESARRHERVSLAVSVLLVVMLAAYCRHSVWAISELYSDPATVIMARFPDGSSFLFDDFREAYSWLRYNSASGSRVLAWWDHGHHVTALANRTSYADASALSTARTADIARVFLSSEAQAHAQLVAWDVDYIAVVCGGASGYTTDDIAKMPWMARIAAADGDVMEAPRSPLDRDLLSARGELSVGRDASAAMVNSLLYKLCYYRYGEYAAEPSRPSGWDRVRGAEVAAKNVSLAYMREVYTTEHWLVRLYRRVDLTANSCFHSK